MRQFCLIVFLLATFACTLRALGQQNSNTDRTGTAPAPDAVIVNFSKPTYPPIAWMANIHGDVHVKVGIRQDGSVESVVAESGHPLLRDAALNSARQTRFDCTGCGKEVTYYAMVYSFQLVAGPDFPCSQSRLRILRSESHITLIAEPRVIEPYFATFRVRSLRCVYFWKCGRHWAGLDYYYYPVRSAKCLGLWDCGRRLQEPWAKCRALNREIW
jgi:TonB family protein